MIQGLTEFLPVSSSGHLVLGGKLLGLTEPHLLFDVVVHVGTLVATVAFYRKSLLDMGKDSLRALKGDGEGTLTERLTRTDGSWLLFMIVLGTIPTGIIGVVFKDPLEALFASPRAAASMLLVTGTVLVATRFVSPGSTARIKPWHALLIGLAQGLAIVPGISRSGSTIACGLILGLDRELAARFSFLLSLPAILGALLLKLLDGPGGWHGGPAPLVVGFVGAAVVGLAALALLIPLVRRGQLHWFALYLYPAGLLGLWLLP